MINLIGTLQQEGQPSLTELNVLLRVITSPLTGQIEYSGFFNVEKEQSVKSPTCTLFLSDKRNADIVIRSSILRGENRVIFFSVIGELY